MQRIQATDVCIISSLHRSIVIYNELGKGIGEILRKLCKEMKVEIIEACPDYIHMLVSILKL